ncbi:MAG: AraC family transcriptional regulator [Bifidobacteriaceae bacterium]|nr:AraC family transcriptional regulator [Bifidobacteriaceae bacterium]
MLLGGLDLTRELIDLWAELPGVMFAIKDAAGRYAEVNEAFVRRSSARSRAQALGRTARELFLPDLAERYEAQDSEVMATGKPLRGELEVIRAQGGLPAWYLTTKLPLFQAAEPLDAASPNRGPDPASARDPSTGAGGIGGREGPGPVLAGPPEAGAAGQRGSRTAVGVVTISTELAALGSSDQIGEALTRVVALVRAALQEAAGGGAAPRLPSVGELAASAGTSVSTLERNMRKVFGLSPRAYMLQQRIDRAMGLLADTDLPISEVAVRTGFYDQPSLTRQLVRLTGETPGGFRRRSRPS